MYAQQPPELTAPRQSSRSKRRRPSQPLPDSHRQLAAEIKLKLAVNAILSLAAIASLVKLLPYQLAQLAQLQEVSTEVREVEGRVERLRTDFSRNFDPHQMRKIMQEQSPFIDPNQRRIFFVSQLKASDR